MLRRYVKEICYGETSKEKVDTRRNICANLWYVRFGRRVIVEWMNVCAWVSDYLWYNIIYIDVDIETVVSALY